MTHTDPLEPDHLARQARWLRRLAISLVGGQDADDVVQETLLVALRRPLDASQGEGALRAWLAGIARNVARAGRRARGRQSQREQAYGELRSPSGPGTDEVVERAARSRQLIDAVLALDEPYRTAVLLAYEERLTAPEIAARTDATPAAVRKRISRGLAVLRARLDADDGAGRVWLAAFAGVSLPQATTLTPWTLGLTMTAKWAAAAATILVLVGLGLWKTSGEAAPESPAPGLTVGALEPEAASPEVLADAPTVPSSEARTVASEADPIAPMGATLLRGRVLLSDDRTPVAGATVRSGDGSTQGLRDSRDRAPLATTDALGKFELDLGDPRSGDLLTTGLWVQHSDIYDVHVDASRISRAAGQTLEIRTVALGEVLVTVLDAAGQPASDVGVTYDLDATIGSEAQVWSYQSIRSAGTSDARGELTVQGIPLGMPISFGLRGEWGGTERLVLTPEEPRAEVTVRQKGWAALTARLEWPDGSPAAHVDASWVGSSNRSGHMGATRGKSDERGILTISDLSTGGGRLQILAPAHHEPVHLRVERGSVTDLGTLRLTKMVRVDGRVTGAQDREIPRDLKVAAFRSGALLEEVPVDGDLRFAIDVPTGPVVLALSKGITWDPIVPYRGSFLGQVEVRAPQSGVELPLSLPFAVVTGRTASGATALELELFDPEPDVSWGIYPIRGGSAEVEPSVDGAFRCLIPPAQARILVRRPDGQTCYSPVASLKAGSTHDLGDLAWDQGTLEVQASGLDGAPIADGLVRLRASSGSTQEARTDRAGALQLEVAPGPYGIQLETSEGISGHWQLVQIEGGATAKVSLNVAEKAVLRGTISSFDGPLAGFPISAQRSNPGSNLILSATTDSDGRFAFQPLLPGTYRYSVRNAFVGSTDLLPGEEKTLTLELSTRRTQVLVLDAGQPLAEAGRLVAAPSAASERLWTSGESLGGGRFEVSLPTGPLLFSIDLQGLGNNQMLLVPGAPASGSDYRLELPGGGIELHLSGAAAHQPCPAGFLFELEGQPAVSQWGREPECCSVDDGLDGTGARIVRFPYLAEGAMVRLQGLSASGERRSESVRVGGGGWTVVRWE